MGNANSTATIDRQDPAALRLEVFHVTGTEPAVAEDLHPDTPAHEVAAALAERMGLPNDVTWALREDRTASYLDGDRAIGDQVETDAQVTLTPRTHLGGGN